MVNVGFEVIRRKLACLLHVVEQPLWLLLVTKISGKGFRGDKAILELSEHELTVASEELYINE